MFLADAMGFVEFRHVLGHFPKCVQRPRGQCLFNVVFIDTANLWHLYGGREAFLKGLQNILTRFVPMERIYLLVELGFPELEEALQHFLQQLCKAPTATTYPWDVVLSGIQGPPSFGWHM